MLAAYMEEWVRSYGSQPPTNVLDEHIENLDLVRKYFEARLSRASFFRNISDGMDKQSKVAYRKSDPSRCKAEDADLDDVWSPLFETYVTLA